MPLPHPSRLIALASVVVAVPLLGAAPASATSTPDGSSQARAAASCWEIKQRTPAAADGAYWVVTPRLQAPLRVRCDMTTDGGGWVLVGRGRDGWSNGGDAKGLPTQVSETVWGTGAYSARQLSGEAVDGLLDGGRVDSLAEGIRVRRATDTTGTSTQELRLRLKNRGRWSWALDAGHPLAAYSVDGTTTTKAQTTANATLSTGSQQLVTALVEQNGFRRGLNYGASGPAGTSDASSALFSTATGGRYASPMAQVWIRPRLTTAGRSYPALPAGGTPAQTGPALPHSWGLPNTWGVTGLGKGGEADTSTEVSAFAQIGNTIYVGGNFTHVQKGANGEKHAQAYLAAFDATTGEWIPSFRPALDHQVKALQAMPDGSLVAGGQFEKVGGTSARGIASLDAATGALRTSWRPQVKQARKEKMWVRTLTLRGSYLYVGGAFTHAASSGSSTFLKRSNIARLTVSAGKVSTWAPDLGGMAPGRAQSTSVVDLTTSPSGAEIYAVGYFQRGFHDTKGRKPTSQPHMAAIATSKKATFRTWKRSYSSGSVKDRRYQQAVEAVGSRVYVGGSQHSLFGYASSNLTRKSGTVTRQGGDLQALTQRAGVVFGSCHCNDFAYATTRLDAAGFTEGDAISLVGAWDAATGRYLTGFSPTLTSRGGEGGWALHAAADGTLWAGGSFTGVTGRDGTREWAGGFVRFTPRPGVPPTPTGFAASSSDGSARLSWSGPAGTTYEVLRGGRVVTSTQATSLDVAMESEQETYAVRAVAGQNRSASTAARAVTRVPAP